MSKRRNRMMLIIIALLFFTPLLLAVAMQASWWGFKPPGTTNLGVLVSPPVPVELDAPDLAGKWTIALVFSSPCTRACQDQARGLRQIHRAAGRHRDEVEVVLVAQSIITKADREVLTDIYERFHFLESDGTADQESFREAAASIWPENPETDQRAFLIDPNGNIMLGYTAEFDPNHIHRDLKRLLKWSQQED